MTTANPGKKFETDFKKSVPIDVFAYRIKTRTTAYKGDNEVADFLVFDGESLFLFELKTTKEKRLPFVMIRPNQLIGIRDALKFKGVYGGIVLQFREPYSHWFVPIHVIEEYIERGAKSIPIADCIERDDIIAIPFTKKKVTCVLDVLHLLEKIKEARRENDN